jgi:transposase
MSSSPSSSSIIAEYRLKGISALERFSMEELELLLYEAKKTYEYTSPYAPILTDIEYDILKEYIRNHITTYNFECDSECD